MLEARINRLQTQIRRERDGAERVWLQSELSAAHEALTNLRKELAEESGQSP